MGANFLILKDNIYGTSSQEFIKTTLPAFYRLTQMNKFIITYCVGRVQKSHRAERIEFIQSVGHYSTETIAHTIAQGKG